MIENPIPEPTRIEIGYVCSKGHFQFHDDPDGGGCASKDIGTIYVETNEWTHTSPEILQEAVKESLASLHAKIEFWRKNA